jgi:hypothetical protein
MSIVTQDQPNMKSTPSQTEWFSECNNRLDGLTCYELVTVSPNDWQGKLILILSKSIHTVLECAAGSYEVPIDKLKRLSYAYYDDTDPENIDYAYPSYTIWR